MRFLFGSDTYIVKKSRMQANATLVDQQFWRDFTSNFTSPEVIAALLKKFDSVLALRKPEYAETVDQFYFNMALTRDVAGYRVDAHTDPAVRAPCAFRGFKMCK